MTDFFLSLTEHDVHTLRYAIGPLYAIVALQFGMSAWRVWLEGRIKEAIPLLYLILIFVLCDLSGYIGQALGWPQWVLFLLHLSLIVGTVAYILTGQAAKAMRE